MEHGQLRCVMCEVRFSSEGRYREHLRARHPRGETYVYECPECAWGFTSFREAVSHQEANHQTITPLRWRRVVNFSPQETPALPKCTQCAYRTLDAKRCGQHEVHQSLINYIPPMPVAGGTEGVTATTYLETAAAGAEPLGAAVGATSFVSQDIRVKQGLIPPPCTPVRAPREEPLINLMDLPVPEVPCAPLIDLKTSELEAALGSPGEELKKATREVATSTATPSGQVFASRELGGDFEERTAFPIAGDILGEWHSDRDTAILNVFIYSQHP